jgi:hypothetical protein
VTKSRTEFLLPTFPQNLPSVRQGQQNNKFIIIHFIYPLLCVITFNSDYECFKFRTKFQNFAPPQSLFNIEYFSNKIRINVSSSISSYPMITESHSPTYIGFNGPSAGGTSPKGNLTLFTPNVLKYMSHLN